MSRAGRAGTAGRGRAKAAESGSVCGGVHTAASKRAAERAHVRWGVRTWGTGRDSGQQGTTACSREREAKKRETETDRQDKVQTYPSQTQLEGRKRTTSV